MGKCARMQAFSLIELLVVITIVGLLAAIGTPVYQTSNAKSLILAGINAAEPLLKDFERAANTLPTAGPGLPSYASNNFWPPNQFMVAGSLQNVYTGRNVTAYGSKISNIGYGTGKSGNSGDGYGGGFTIRMPNTSGYLTSTHPYFEIKIAYRWVNNTLVMACGIQANISFGTFPAPPASLLPSNCQCANVDWWAAVGDFNNSNGCPRSF